MTEKERRLHDSIVHGLRMQGWSRMEANDEALSRIDNMRQRERKRVEREA